MASMGNGDNMKRARGRRGNGEGSVRQLPEGGWRGAIALGKDVNGKQIRKYVLRQTQSEVISELRALRLKQENNQPITSGKKRTVEAFFKDWLEDHVKATKAPLTYRGYEQLVRMYIVPRLGRIILDKLTGQDVQRCLNLASKDGLSPTTVKNINAVIKTAMTTAKRWQFVDRNVAKDATPPKQKKYKAKFLTVPQAEKLLRVMEGHRYEAMIVVALMMGLRHGEVAGLRWSEIDFFECSLNVAATLQRIPGEGVQLQDVKSESSRRTCPIPAYCMDALLRRRQIQEQEKVRAGEKWKQDSDFVLTSRYGARIVPEEMNRELNEALKRASLPHVRFHDLRHSTASLLIHKGVAMKIVQDIMGHSSYQITADTYSHLLPSHLKGAMKTMNRLFQKPQKANVAPNVAPRASAAKRETVQ